MPALDGGKGIVRPVTVSRGDIDIMIRGGNFRLVLNVDIGTDTELVRLREFSRCGITRALRAS